MAMPTNNESVVVVSFDKEMITLVELSCEREKVTRWLLVSSIPITVTLSQALQCLNSCIFASSSITYSDAGDAAVGGSPKGGGGVSADEAGIGIVRVGYTPSEDHTYCLLLQFTTASGAEYVKNELLHADLTGEAPTLSEYIHPKAKIITSSLADHEREQHDPTKKKEITLEELLCGVVLWGVAPPPPPVSHSQSDHHESSSCSRALWRGLERQGGTHLPSAGPLVPVGDFCSICQDNTSGKPFIVTLCKHVFHLLCFCKHLEGGSASCPLCRFSMDSLESRCNACGACSDLWTCLVCGWIACGLGYRNDTLRHFESTGHSCAIQNETFRIWNYRANDFVHHQLAIELGKEDDAKAAKAAARDVSDATMFGGGEADITASSYWRSRWWWDEKDEEAAAAHDLSDEYVQQYYLGIMRRLVAEQSEYYERGAGRGALQPAAMAGGETQPKSSAAALRKLMLAERRERQRLVSDYTSGMSVALLHEEMAFNRIVKQETLRNNNLREEMLLQLHVNKNLHIRNEQMRESIIRASERGREKVKLREEKLKELQEKHDVLLKSFE